MQHEKLLQQEVTPVIFNIHNTSTEPLALLYEKKNYIDIPLDIMDKKLENLNNKLISEAIVDNATKIKEARKVLL